MLKKDRHAKILEIIRLNEIDTQGELTQKLNEIGVEVTQATISRDIQELHLIKIAGKVKKYKYAFIDKRENFIPDKIVNLFKEILVSITCVNNLIVIKTLSGNASAAGMVVDRMNFSEILGCVAGDDTLLIITKSNSDAEMVIKEFKELMK